MYDVNTEHFNGSGLLLDKCQDGSFENMNIQLCGRLKEGETDVSDINATEYSAIHLFLLFQVMLASCFLRFGKFVYL